MASLDLPMDQRRAATGHEWAAVDGLVRRGDPAWAFLRARWFTAGATPASDLVIARDGAGNPLAAIPLVERRRGPFTLREVAGGYWPFRGIPVDTDAQLDALVRSLHSVRRDLGQIWRLGPVAEDDLALAMLVPAARAAGWQVLRRPLGTLFELDLGALRTAGDWPSAKTQRKNRWRKRRLEESGGALTIRFFTGADWTAADRDAMASIEAASWLGTLPGGGDTKFRDPSRRRYWEGLCNDPALAAMVFGSLLTIGDTPAAFTFGIEAGATRYYIANNYDDRFTQFGPGRVLLYDDFEHAAAHGVTRISWGLGDAGYKSEMGARPGPALADLLFVRNRLLAAALRPLWERPA